MTEFIIDFQGKPELIIAFSNGCVEIYLTEETIIDGKPSYNGLNKILDKEQTMQLLMYLYENIFKKETT